MVGARETDGMELRDATTEDVEGIRNVARASLAESYGHAIEEAVIDTAVDDWYDGARLSAKIADENAIVPVAVDQGKVLGFAESVLVEGRHPVGEIDWLHVDPDSRDRGIGSDLLARVETELRERDVTRIEASVLVANVAGGEFYESKGYDRGDEDDVTIGDEEFGERRYVKYLDADGEEVLVESYTTEDGEEVYVAFDESDRGDEAPFYVAYLSQDREDRYGFFCGNCESLDVAIDTMDAVECNQCGNRMKPSRWDQVYL